jgi:hypothetical protein
MTNVLELQGLALDDLVPGKCISSITTRDCS